MATHRNLWDLKVNNPLETSEKSLDNVKLLGDVKTESSSSPRVLSPENNITIEIKSKLLDVDGNEIVKPEVQPSKTIPFFNGDFAPTFEIPHLVSLTEFTLTEASTPPNLEIDPTALDLGLIDFKLKGLEELNFEIQTPTFISGNVETPQISPEINVTSPTTVVVPLPKVPTPFISVSELTAGAWDKYQAFLENKETYTWLATTAWSLEYSASIVTQWNREREQNFSDWLTSRRAGWEEWLEGDDARAFWLGHAGNRVLDFIGDSVGLFNETMGKVAGLYSGFSNSVSKQITDTLYADKMPRKRLKVSRPQYKKGTNDSWKKLWGNIWPFGKKEEKTENKEEKKAEKENKNELKKAGIVDPHETVADTTSFLLFTHIMKDLDAQLQYYIMYFTTRDSDGEEQLLKVPAHYVEWKEGKVEKIDKDYFYYFYINSISFKPFSGQTSSVNYGPYKLKTKTFTGSKNENTFTLKTTVDMGLSFYDYVAQKCMGLVWENGLISSQMRGNDFYMTGKADALRGIQNSRVDMHIVVHSKTIIDENNKKKFYVNRFILKDILFNKLGGLDFNQGGNKMDIPISGIYRKCYFVHNELLP